MMRAAMARAKRQSKTGRQARRVRKAPREMERHPVIDNTEPLSTEELGRIYNIPPERVRELKEFAAKLLDRKKPEVSQ